ncbi:MAG: hypothetical protein SPE24_08530 [Erysipelotrichaceae bacterium]|nr:hypothetical protein [Erysipelotrichaceae bacterium]
MMGNNEFEKIVKSLVAEYANNHVDKSDGVKITEIVDILGDIAEEDETFDNEKDEIFE